MIPPAQSGPQASIHRVLLVLGLLGIAALLLPFTFGESPLSALTYAESYRVAAPALLAVFVTVGSLRWLAAGMLPRLARTLAYLISAGSAATTLWLLRESNWGDTVQGRLRMTVPLVILLLGAWFVARSRAGRSSGFAPVMALQAAYLAHAAMCLLSFWPDWQVGAYLVLTTAAVYASQIALLATQRATA